MPAQLNDILYSERVGIPGKMTVEDILALARPSIAFHDDVELTAGNDPKQVLKNDGTGIYRNNTLNLNDLDDVNTEVVIPNAGWIMKHNGTEYVPAMRESIRNKNIVINTTTALANGIVISQAFNFQRVGIYSLDIKMNYSCDIQSSDIQVALTLGGQNVSLITAGYILKEESKDAAGNDGDGRGTDQKKMGAGRYYFNVTTLGNQTLVLRFDSQVAGVESAIWESSIIIEEEFGLIEV